MWLHSQQTTNAFSYTHIPCKASLVCLIRWYNAHVLRTLVLRQHTKVGRPWYVWVRSASCNENENHNLQQQSCCTQLIRKIRFKFFYRSFARAEVKYHYGALLGSQDQSLGVHRNCSSPSLSHIHTISRVLLASGSSHFKLSCMLVKWLPSFVCAPRESLAIFQVTRHAMTVSHKSLSCRSRSRIQTPFIASPCWQLTTFMAQWIPPTLHKYRLLWKSHNVKDD